MARLAWVGVIEVMQPIENLRQRVRSNTREAFVTDFPAPVLVATAIIGGRLGRAMKASHRTTTGRMARLKPSTLVHIDPTEIANPREDDIMVTRPLQREMWVPVVKSATTPRDAQITIGRFASCDVVINDYTISKQHACIAIDPLLGSFKLTDTGSTNGTSVSGMSMEAGQTVTVKSGTEVIFGRLIFTLMNAFDFFDFLHGRPLSSHRPFNVALTG